MSSLKLEMLTSNDSEEYMNLIREDSEEKIAKHASDFIVKNKDEFEKFISQNHWKVISIKNSKNIIVGAIILEDVFLMDMYEITFFIGEKYRGNHYSSEALKMLIEKLKLGEIKKLLFNIRMENKTAKKIVDDILGGKFDHVYEEYEEYHIINI